MPAGLSSDWQCMLASRPGTGFRKSAREVYRNRYFVREAAAVVAKRHQQRKLAKRWYVEDSIWNGRQFRGGENRGFYDDDSVVRCAIECDFRKALGKGLLQAYLLKHDHAAPDPQTQPEEVQAPPRAPPRAPLATASPPLPMVRA